MLFVRCGAATQSIVDKILEGVAGCGLVEDRLNQSLTSASLLATIGLFPISAQHITSGIII
jgi:hypothetical protein